MRFSRFHFVVAKKILGASVCQRNLPAANLSSRRERHGGTLHRETHISTIKFLWLTILLGLWCFEILGFNAIIFQ